MDLKFQFDDLVTSTTQTTPTANGPRPDWWFLGNLIKELSEPGGGLVVAEATLPAGASPPLHVHSGLDDSFYVLEGRMVVRCRDDVSLATAGTWVPFPSGVPHTFRVLDSPARILTIHANDSFMGLVRAIGRPAGRADVPTTDDGPSFEELSRLSAAHGITTMGPSMSEHEAQAWCRRSG
jgi:quercetin dioxygenase-like cupin family protein